MKGIPCICLLLAGLTVWPGCRPSSAARRDVPLREKPVWFTRDDVASSPVSNRLRVCTYNIQHLTDGYFDGFHRSPGRARRQACGAAELIAEINPDILVIQEIENVRILKRLNDCLDVPFAAGCITRFYSPHRRGRKQNIALLTRVPVKRVRELEFGLMDVPNRPPRGMLRFVVDLDAARRLLVYAVHLKSNMGEAEINIARRKSALVWLQQDAARMIKTEPDAQWEVMIAGDMNVDPDGAGFEADDSLAPVAEWVDLWRGVPLPERTTIPTRYGNTNSIYPPAAFDRFIVSPEMTSAPWTVGAPVSIQRGVNTTDVYMRTGTKNVEHYSDHYPVYLDVVR
ncbi:MAG: endonuclease/exonuclease/phosphatase family protein [Spartobacteria bacterium]|nr:endonuclease/exonuclease/phosphatase family protein [Spartobacteria bacterium]